MTKEPALRNVYENFFQRRGASPVNASSPAVVSFVLGVSRARSSSTDLVCRHAFRNATNSIRYTGARLLKQKREEDDLLHCSADTGT